MNIRCQICGSERISLKHSKSSVFSGEVWVCSSNCSLAANRYALLVCGLLSLIPLLFLGEFVGMIIFVFISLFYLRQAYRGFSFAENPHSKRIPGSYNDSRKLSEASLFAINNPPISAFLKSRLDQNYFPSRESSNESENSITKRQAFETTDKSKDEMPISDDSDPHGFFDLSNGRLKQFSNTRKNNS